jgi:hypothetical protein
MQRWYPIIGSKAAQAAQQDAEKAHQQKKTVIWFIWFVSFVWLNQTDHMNQINKINECEHPACGTLVVLYAWVIESHCAAIVVPQPVNRLKPVENQV